MEEETPEHDLTVTQSGPSNAIPKLGPPPRDSRQGSPQCVTNQSTPTNMVDDPPVAVTIATAPPDKPNTTKADSQKSEGIATLRRLTGVVKTKQVELDTDIAESIEKVLTHGLDEESKNNLTDSIKMPANCARLEVLGCNPEIYRQASAEAKNNDRELQEVQKSLIQGISALGQAMSEEGACADHLAAALASMGEASHKLDIARRKNFKFKPFINDEYKALCLDSYPVEGLLFNKDLGDRVKSLGDANKVAKSLRKEDAQQRKRPFPFLRGGQASGGGAWPVRRRQPPQFQQRGIGQTAHKQWNNRGRGQKHTMMGTKRIRGKCWN
ncbi:hypothetical protein ElyMa_002633300 [Elysia marginata]|uniref:Uncharacterized protein n=1 Tax=Elysia marginata TaxID=1093978 RepID=A0AAV4H5S8_9GAST|nr:hypothetical protein ElyMa_002633300 [Elysia marginata]